MKVELLSKTCVNCSADFNTTRGTQKFCKSSCKVEHRSFRNGDRESQRYEKYVHRNTMENLPLPGDVVYVVNSLDKEIKIDTIGIITGVVGTLEDQYEVLFAPYLPVMVHRDKTVQCASGIKRMINIKDFHRKGDVNMLFEFTNSKKADDLILVKRFLVTV